MSQKLVLYTTECPKCNVLKTKLDEKKMAYYENNVIEEMTELGIMSIPMLSVDGKLLDFIQANQWINSIEVNNG